MRQDLLSALRIFVREPGFAAVVVLTLALGIGANTAIFSVVNSVLLRPLAFHQPDRLVTVSEVVPKVAQLYPVLPVNLSHYFDWKKQSKSFERLALMRTSSMNLTGAGAPALLKGARISANLFEVLGLRMPLGQPFTESQERMGQDQVVILSHAVWVDRFHGDPSVIGRKAMLDGKPYVVAGVAPEGFAIPWTTGLSSPGHLRTTQFFIPLGYTPEDLEERFGDFNWTVIARLRPQVTVERALSELNVLQSAISNSLPNEKLELRAAIQPLRDSITGDSRRGLIVVMSAVGAVLLVLCVNLANLWFARAAGHSRENAIRVALGAGRSRLVRQMLTESLTLAAVGGALGTALAYAGLGLLLRAAPADLPRIGEVRMDGLALGFALAVSLLAGVFFGILPAIRVARQDPQESLKSAGRSNTEGVHGVWVRKTLVAAEVGLSTILLITAGLLIRSFERLINVDRGFDVERVLALDVALPATKYTKREQQAEFFRRLVEKSQSMPGVLSASIVSALPLQGETWIDLVSTENDTHPLFERPTANVRFISPDYFKTIGAPLKAGRMFNDGDRAHPVAIVSQSIAQQLWPGQEALGRTLLHNEKEKVEVVGVTPDLRSTSLDHDPVNMLYIPYWQRPRLGASLLLKTAMDPRAIAATVRGAIWELDGEVPVPEMRTLVDVLNKSVGARRFNMVLVMAFAISALALASFGVYGVLAYSVARRRAEIGIRMALGADAARVWAMVLGQGMEPVAFGLAAGLAASLAIGRVLSSLLFQVSARDPLTMAAVVSALCAVALAACALPAVRATRVNPIVALRCE